jgi:predicted amidophosphoribosyltransferase
MSNIFNSVIIYCLANTQITRKFENTKGVIRILNRRTDNTMAKRKSTNNTSIYKTLHRKKKIEQQMHPQSPHMLRITEDTCLLVAIEFMMIP